MTQIIMSFSEVAWLVSGINEPTVFRVCTTADSLLLFYMLRKNVKLRHKKQNM